MKKIPTKYNKRFSELWALCDDQDAEFLAKYSWSLLQLPNERGMIARARMTIEGRDKSVFMHQMVVLLSRFDPLLLGERMRDFAGFSDMLGFIGKVRHANGNRLDNRRGNLVAHGLRLTTVEQQESNQQSAEASETAPLETEMITPEAMGDLGSDVKDIL